MNSSDWKLTEQQVTFFHAFGYLALPQFMAGRIGRITDEFEALWARHGGGHAGKLHDGKARSCLAPCIDRSEYLSTLLDDPRIIQIATTLLGDDFNYMGSDGNFYVGDTGWHSDGWHASIRHIKLAFYLDPLTRDTGCLRVIPGSHNLGDQFANALQEQIYQCQERWNLPGREVPAVALETRPGDILLFNHNVKHASFGGHTRRRMFTMNLCQRYPAGSLQELRDYLAGGARFWVTRGYGEEMLRTAGPQRMRHLEQVLANDGHLAELSRQAREKMAEPSRG